MSTLRSSDTLAPSSSTGDDPLHAVDESDALKATVQQPATSKSRTDLELEAMSLGIEQEIVKQTRTPVLKTLVERNQQLVERNQQLVERNQQLVERNQQLVELKAQKQQLEAQGLKDSVLRQHSIEHTYLSSGKATLPSLKMNQNVQPSVGGNTRRTKIIKGDEPVAIDVKIPQATILFSKKPIWIDPSNVQVPTLDSQERSIPSDLSQAGLADSFQYHNEFGIQNLCLRMVNDALKCLGLFQEVQARTELSIYMMKPDITVVLQYAGVQFYTIEVKSPDPSGGNKVFESEATAGQKWSYQLGAKQLGIEQPMGAIMTYNKLVLVTLEEDFADTPKHKEIVEFATNQLRTGKIPDLQKNGEGSQEACWERQSSPIRKPTSVSAKVKRQQDAASKAGDMSIVRQVFYSQIYEAGAVFPALLQSLLIAYLRCKSCEAPPKQVLSVAHNDDLGSRLFFKISECAFDWVQTEAKLTANTRDLPAKKTVHFYILGKLGEGNSATVYAACNRGGKVCAIKSYHVEKSTEALDSARTEEETARALETFRGTAKEEESRWHLVYGKRFKGVRALWLGGRPCLMMPYGREINTERAEKIPDVQNELNELASHGFRYKNSDVRWRHILLDYKGKVFLTDFESLEEIPSDVHNDVAVEEQMKMLKEAINDTQESEAGAVYEDQESAAYVLGGKQEAISPPSEPASKKLRTAK